MSTDLRRRCGAILKELREGANLTQAQLAEMIGRSQPTLYKWENGKTEPSLDVRRQLADVLGADPYAIVPAEKAS